MQGLVGIAYLSIFHLLPAGAAKKAGVWNHLQVHSFTCMVTNADSVAGHLLMAFPQCCFVPHNIVAGFPGQGSQKRDTWVETLMPFLNHESPAGSLQPTFSSLGLCR